VVWGDQKVGMALGDVMGRGVRAAAIMGQVRMAFRAYAMEHQVPSHVLDRVARLLTSLDPQHFSTMVYLTLDLHEGVGSMARAGHLPPLFIPKDGEARYLAVRESPPLCAVSLNDHEEIRFEFGSGDTLVLFTDGLIGRRELESGMERMRTVAARATGDVEALCDRILEQMPLDADDDVAVVAVRLD
jgi:serine phosphatase RsbU (regulator of sigma subunit)